MEDRRLTDFRLSAMTQDALIKSSSDASSLLQPTQQLVPPMLPSLDAYLDAYRSLMSQDVQAITALGGCGLGIRPPGMTMPVLPTAAAAAAAAASLVSSPYYGLSPYSTVDLARYGLLSPVYVPPFIAPLLCGGAGGSSGLLPTTEPLQSSPGVLRPAADRDAPACPPQSFSKSLFEACATARKNDSAVTAVGAAGRPKQPDAVSKPARHDPHLVDRVKPTSLASPRTAAHADLSASDRKWNSSGKVDRTDAAHQSSTAVDFSVRLKSDASAKSSVAGSALSPDSWKFSPASATSLIAGKNAADNSTHSYSSNTVTSRRSGDQKVDGDPVKAVHNGQIERDAGVKTVADSSRVSSVMSADQPKHKVATSQNDESKVIHQSDGTCRVTSSGLSESDTQRMNTDASVGSRRPSRPVTKKRPTEPGVALPAGSELASPGDADGKSRSGNVEEFRCRLCNYSGRSQHCLSKHYRAHDLAYKICRYCRRAFERPSDLLRHEERHRRRDVLGSGGTGGLDASSDTAVSCSSSDVARQPAVARIESYVDGVVESSSLLSARLGQGDNEVILCFDEPAADALVDQPTAPPPSKLRDVYSIMAGIFVNQQFFSFGQSPPLVGGSDQTTPRPGVDDRGGPLVPDFGQQAFLQMLDLKMVSGSDSSSPVYGGGPGHVSPRGATTATTTSGGSRERRRKGVPNRAIDHDATDTSVPVITFSGSSDIMDAGKTHDVDEVAPAFTSCNGVLSGKMGPGADSIVVAGYPTDAKVEPASVASSHKFHGRRRSRKFFNISCTVCGKRLLQGSELGRHWMRHSVQDADGCYSCAACSFTSNVRLIMHTHAHIHLTRHRSNATLKSSSGLRCRLCAKPRRRTHSTKRGGVLPVWKTPEDCGLVKSLWCSECSCRLATSKLLKLLRQNRCSVKSLGRRLRLKKGAGQDSAGDSIANTEAGQSCT